MLLDKLKTDRTIFIKLLWLTVFPVILSIVFVIVSQYSFLLFHILIESFTIFIAMFMLVAVWQMYPFPPKNFLVFLACGYFWVGVLDFIHTLSYRGMNIFPGIIGVDMATQTWVSARYLEAITLLVAPIFIHRKTKRNKIFILFGLITFAVVFLIYQGYFPAVFIEGQGLTTFKINSGYLINVLLAMAVFHLWLNHSWLDKRIWLLTTGTIILTMAAELSFTLYDAYGIANFVGHIFKLFSFWLLYLAVIRITFREPLIAMAQSTNTYEALPDATLVVDRQGVIHQANKAACQLAGMQEYELLNQHCHGIFHPAYVNQDKCPVCEKIAWGIPVTGLQMKLVKKKKWYEYSLAKIEAQYSHQGMVQIIRDITRQYIAEEGLRAAEQERETSEAQLRLLMNATYEAIYGVDVNGDCTFVNPACLKMLGYTQEAELLGQNIYGLIHQQPGRQAIKSIKDSSINKVMQTEEGLHRDNEVIWRKEGSYFYAEYWMYPLFMDKICIGVVVTFIDITERCNSEHEIRELNELMSSIIENLPSILFVKDARTSCYVQWNKHAEEVIGFTKDQVIGKNYFDLFPESEADFFTEIDRRVLSKGQLIDIPEEVIQTKSKEVRTMHTKKIPIYDAEGQPRYLLGLSEDITRRKQTEKELGEYRNHLEELVEKRTAKIKEQAKIIDQIHDAVITTDMNGVVLNWNRGAEKMFGYPEHEVMGRNLLMLYLQQKQGDFEQEILVPLKAQGKYEIETRLLRKNGEVFNALMSLSVLSDEQGRPKGMIAYLLDITVRKQAEVMLKNRSEELLAMNRELETFSYSVSHDLRGPLRSITGFSEALLEDACKDLDERGKNYLQRIQKASLAMGDTIDGLLSLSRISHQTLGKTHINLSQLAQEIIATLLPHDGKSGCQIDITQNIEVDADEKLIRIVLSNLFSNAIKFSRKQKQPKIALKVIQDDSEIAYCVEDNGIGFDMQHVSQLFEPFRRLHSESEYQGTGIGLATVARIILRHGGHIWANSSPDNGARFYFTLGQEYDRDKEELPA